jgi:hypothetical protein
VPRDDDRDGDGRQPMHRRHDREQRTDMDQDSTNIDEGASITIYIDIGP